MHELFISDLHAGDQLAICPPGLVDYSGLPIPTFEFQEQLFETLERHLNKAKKWFNGDKFNLTLGSELVQGDWSRFANAQTMPIQFTILYSILDLIIDVLGSSLKKTWILTGSEAHTGLDNRSQASLDSKYMTALKVQRTPVGRMCWLAVERRLTNGALLHSTHNFNFTNVYTGTAYQREWEKMRVRRALHGEPEPDICYRAHVHKFHFYPMAEDHPLTDVGCFTTPGWQGKTDYVMKSMGGRWDQTEFGLCALSLDDKGKYRLKRCIERIQEDWEGIK